MTTQSTATPDSEKDASDSPAPPPTETLRRNVLVLFGHGFLGQTGFRLLQAPTFFPTYVALLTGVDAAVGAARAVQSLGMFLSPLFGVGAVQSRQRVKHLMLLFGGLMRLQILLLALIALFAPLTFARWAIWPVVFVWGLGSGLQIVVFNFLLAKSVPIHLRGRLLGSRNLVSGLTLIVVSGMAGWFLDEHGFPVGYGLAFLLAFGLTTLGLFSLVLLRESPTVELRARASGWAQLRTVPGLLSDDPEFARFVSARLLAAAGSGSLPYYVVYFGGHLGTSGSLLAGWTIAYAVAEALAALTWGVLGDRWGFQRVFLAALGCWILASVLTLTVPPTVGLAYVVFPLVAAGFSGLLLSAQTLVLEFGSEGDRALRIASTHSLTELVRMIGFAGAGVVAGTISIPFLLVGSIVLQLSSGYRVLGLRRKPAR